MCEFIHTGIIKRHNLSVTERFKYVFIDCGTEKVLENAVPLFWSRLLMNGVMILDHYNNPTSPSESNIIDNVIGNNSIEKFYFSDHPSAFIIKKK